MAQAHVEMKKTAQRVNLAADSMDTETDSGLDLSEDLSILENYSQAERIGTAETKRIIVSGKNVQVRLCNIGNYHLRAVKKLKCTHRYGCPIQLHACQGILSDHRDSPLDQHKPEIKLALMLRITRDVHGGDFRECLLCEKSFEKGAEILAHVCGHGAELGKAPTQVATIVSQLEKLDLRIDKNKVICGDCEVESATPFASLVHRARFHLKYWEDPSLCDFCHMPLFGQSFEEHFEGKHAFRCCGEILRTAGMYMAHFLSRHPQEFERLLGIKELPAFFSLTKCTDPEKELPWGNAARIVSKKIAHYCWNRRENSTPGAKSEKFRQHYASGKGQNALADNTLYYAANWNILMNLKNASHSWLLVETERLVIRFVAERHVEYIKRQEVSRENPLKNEYSTIEVYTTCPRCFERADHSKSSEK
jgi:hypothetical protein